MRRSGVHCVAYPPLLLLAIAPLAAAHSAVVAPPSAPASQPSLQQAFDEASNAADKGDCATALPIFERLAADSHIKPGTLPAGTIAVRRGKCLLTAQRYDEAEKQILAGLPILRQAGPQMVLDVADGEEALGTVAMLRRDHDGAVSHFKAAMETSAETARVHLLVKLAQVTQFDGGEEPLGYLDQALRILGATAAKPNRVSAAAIHTVRGRILMNQGRNKEALAELKQALSLSGGLTSSKVSLSEASMRGDLAEASLLNGDKDQARLYLAYTGAGRIKESPFAVAASMAPPQCGPETGLSPEDSAIVEFGINEAGDVPVASTVYTRGNYAVAAAFAQAVEQWFWQPSDLAKIPPFFKVLTRVELRCSISGGQLLGEIAPLRERFGLWATPLLDGIDIETAKVGSSLERLAALAKQRERDGNLPATVAAMTAHGILDPRPGPAVMDDFDKAIAIASTAQLPPDVVNAILVFRSDASQRLANGMWRRRTNPHVGDSADALVSAHPTLEGDALADDTLLLITTPSAPVEAERSNAVVRLAHVADDRRLSDHHPLRQVALLRLANLAASEGKLEDAHALFNRTGLSEEQCSLIGATPAMKSSGASSSDFPMEALKFGFEGWVNLEFDINANGTTARARAVIAYPPFVFVDAATGMARDIHYQVSYRPSNALACSARRETIRFQIPSNH